MKVAKGELALALAFVALGVLWIVRAAGMPLWDGFAPASGLMPLVYGILLVGLAAAVIVFSRDPRPEEPAGKALIVIAAVAAAIIGLSLVGFAPSIFLLLFVLYKVVERLPLVRSIAVAAGTTAVLYLLFKTWLGVPLP